MEGALARASNIIVLLVEIETDSLPIRAWTGSGDLVFEGNTFSGVGQFGSVSEIEETTEIAARGMQFGLSGIPSSLLSSALQDMRQGRTAKLWMGIVKNRILDNYIPNGFFELDISDWTDISTAPADITWNSSFKAMNINETAAEDAGGTIQLTGLTIGQEYFLYFEIDDSGANGVDVAVGTTAGNGDLFINSGYTNERNKIIFTPTVTNPWVTFGASGTFSNDTVTVGRIVVLENLPVPLLDDPVLLWQGAVDSVTIVEGAESSSVNVSAENRLIRLENGNERRFTREDQQLFAGGDKGFDYVLGLQEKEIKWGRV